MIEGCCSYKVVLSSWPEHGWEEGMTKSDLVALDLNKALPY